MEINVNLLIQDLLKIEPPKTAQICPRIKKDAQYDVGFDVYELSPDRKKVLEDYFRNYIQQKMPAFASLTDSFLYRIIQSVETGEPFRITDPRLRDNPNERLQLALDQSEKALNNEIDKKRDEEMDYRVELETPPAEQEQPQEQSQEQPQEQPQEQDKLDVDEEIFAEGADFPGKGVVTWTVPTGRKGAPVEKDFSLALKFWKDPENIEWMERAAKQKASRAGGNVNDLVAQSMHIMSNAIADKLSFFAGDDWNRNESGSAYYPLKMMSKGEFPILIRDVLSKLPQFQGIVEHMKQAGFNLDKGYHGEDQSAFARSLMGTQYEDAILQWIWNNPSHPLIRKWIVSGVTPQLKRDAIAGKGLSLDWLAEKRTEEGDGTAGDIASEQGYVKQQYDFSDEQKSELYSEFLKDKVIPYFDNKVNTSEDILKELSKSFRSAALSDTDWGKYRENFRDTANIISEVSNKYLPNFTDVFFDASGEFIQNMSKYIDVNRKGEDTVITFINPDNTNQRLPVVLRNYDSKTGTFDGVDMRVLSMVKAFGGGKIGNENMANDIIDSFNNNMQTAGGASAPAELSNRIKEDLSRKGYNVDKTGNFIDAFVNNFAHDDYPLKNKINNALYVFKNALGISSIDAIKNQSILKDLFIRLDDRSGEDKRLYKNILSILSGNFSGDISSLSENDKKNIAMQLYMKKYASTMSGKELEGALSRSVRDSQLLPFLAQVADKRKQSYENLSEEEKQEKYNLDKEAIQFILDAFNFDYRRYAMPFKHFGHQNNKFYSKITNENKKNYELFWDILGVEMPDEINLLIQEFPNGIPVKTPEIEAEAASRGITADEMKDYIKNTTKNIVRKYRNLLPMKRADHELYLQKLANIDIMKDKFDSFASKTIDLLGYSEISELDKIKKLILGG